MQEHPAGVRVPADAGIGPVRHIQGGGPFPGGKVHQEKGAGLLPRQIVVVVNGAGGVGRVAQALPIPHLLRPPPAGHPPGGEIVQGKQIEKSAEVLTGILRRLAGNADQSAVRKMQDVGGLFGTGGQDLLILQIVQHPVPLGLVPGGGQGVDQQAGGGIVYLRFGLLFKGVDRFAPVLQGGAAKGVLLQPAEPVPLPVKYSGEGVGGQRLLPQRREGPVVETEFFRLLIHYQDLPVFPPAHRPLPAGHAAQHPVPEGVHQVGAVILPHRHILLVFPAAAIRRQQPRPQRDDVVDHHSLRQVQAGELHHRFGLLRQRGRQRFGGKGGGGRLPPLRFSGGGAGGKGQYQRQGAENSKQSFHPVCPPIGTESIISYYLKMCRGIPQQNADKNGGRFHGLRFWLLYATCDVSAVSPQAKCGLEHMARKPKLGELECEAPSPQPPATFYRFPRQGKWRP